MNVYIVIEGEYEPENKGVFSSMAKAQEAIQGYVKYAVDSQFIFDDGEDYSNVKQTESYKLAWIRESKNFRVETWTVDHV